LFVILIVALALGWWLDRRSVPARFQMQVTTNRAYVLDTATGQVWSQKVLESGDFPGGALELSAIKLQE